jgi:gluconokinase
MERGTALTDEDRAPWLQNLRTEMERWDQEKPRTVLACSALKEKYRDLLSSGNSVTWFYLKGPQDLIRKRLVGRKEHFAMMDLLANQFEILEEPAKAIEVDIRPEPDMIIRKILERLKG